MTSFDWESWFGPRHALVNSFLDQLLLCEKDYNDREKIDEFLVNVITTFEDDIGLIIQKRKVELLKIQDKVDKEFSTSARLYLKELEDLFDQMEKIIRSIGKEKEIKILYCSYYYAYYYYAMLPSETFRTSKVKSIDSKFKKYVEILFKRYETGSIMLGSIVNNFKLGLYLCS